MTDDFAESHGEGEQDMPFATCWCLLPPAAVEYLEGQRDPEDPQNYERILRYRTKTRIDALADELALLHETGHEDIVRSFFKQATENRRDASLNDYGDG